MSITSYTTENPLTGVRTTVRLPSEGTHPHLTVFRRHVRTDPLYDENGRQIGWYTKPADWYLAWGRRTRYGTTYSYEGLEAERGFKTKREALARKREILSERGRL